MRRYRRNNPINKTTGTIFVLLMLTLAATGYSYSLWSKTLTIQGTIKTAKAQLIITSHKLLIPNVDFNGTHPIHYYVTSDNLTLVADCENRHRSRMDNKNRVNGEKQRNHAHRPDKNSNNLQHNHNKFQRNQILLHL